MPFFSIVIPAYNVERYLRSCLQSVENQEFGDYQVVIVDDASTDGSLVIAEEYASKDDRFSVVSHGENRGLHLARKTGVENANGEYVLFLDSDDELASGVLDALHARISADPVDILHFGAKVVPHGAVLECECNALEKSLNGEVGKRIGNEILQTIFDEDFGYVQDWRMIQRVFHAPLLRRAFSEMEDARLERAEDSYECFVACALAESADTYDACIGYVYHYGRGITGTSKIDADRYDFFCSSFSACIKAAERFAAEHPSDIIRKGADGLRLKCLELLANDIPVRLDRADWASGLASFAKRFGETSAAREFYRFARDRSYELLQGEEVDLLDDDVLFDYLALAESVVPTDDDARDLGRYRIEKSVAENHVAALFARRLSKRREDSRVKIFVSAHKDVDVPQSPVFLPVQVGAASAGKRFDGYYQDDEGENISDKNPFYCELTTQYWAWKNMDADYYGFCHYRRYFDFSSVRHEENPYGEIIAQDIDADAVKKYCLDEESVLAAVQGYDVITTEFKDLRDFPGDFSTPLEHYDNAPKLHIEDLELVCSLVRRRYPDYAEDVDTFLHGHTSCFCNMFIMKRELFFAYCEWLFSILEECDGEADVESYSKEALRTPGHLAERLFNIYYIHHMRVGSGWRTKTLQCVHFEHPEKKGFLKPAFDGSAVPVVFAADNNYVPQLCTAVYSLVANTSPARKYDIVVFSKDITARNASRMFRFITDGRPNVSLRFYDVSHLVRGYKLEANAHISTETYYRFLIQSVFPDYQKVLYLDSDLVVDADVAELYDTKLGDNLLAAVLDADYLGNLNMKDGQRVRYSKEKLGMKDPYSYFQAGVLLFNVAAMKHFHSQEEWLSLASVPYLYNDQDILNSHCEGRVKYVDFAWNMMIDSGRLDAVISFSPAWVHQAYLDSRENPKIVHYAGAVKPWSDPTCDFADVFWRYARRTPFYEELIARLFDGEALMDRAYQYVVNRHAARSLKRKIGDIVLPYGSKRREAVKRFFRRA